MKIGAKVKELRVQKGLTQEELADRTEQDQRKHNAQKAIPKAQHQKHSHRCPEYCKRNQSDHKRINPCKISYII